MRSHYTFYPIVRRSFQNAREIGEVINRSVSYVNDRLVGKKEFTVNDKRLILAYMGKSITQMDEVFIREAV